MNNSTDSINSTHFEDAITSLEAIITQLEQGELSLETSLAQFEKGIALARNCQTILKAAEQKVEIIINSNSDSVDSQ